jgi:hypothetical protein
MRGLLHELGQIHGRLKPLTGIDHLARAVDAARDWLRAHQYADELVPPYEYHPVEAALGADDRDVSASVRAWSGGLPTV